MAQPNSSAKDLIAHPSFPLFILLVGSFFLTLFFRISASVVMPMEGERLGMSASYIGFISSLHFYTYAFMQPISGILHDRYGPLRVVSAGLLVTSASCLLLTFVRTPFTLAAWRLLSGFGVAPMYSGVLVFQAFAFPPEHYAFYGGVNAALSNLGSIVSVVPLGFALDAFGTSPTFGLLSAIPFAMAMVLIRKTAHDPIRLSGGGKEKETVLSIFSSMGKAMKFIYKNRRVRALQALWAMSSASLLTFQGLWGVAWFATAFSAPPGQARFWGSMVSFGMLLGPVFTSKVIVSPGRLPGIMRKVGFVNALSWVFLLWAAWWGKSIELGGAGAFMVGVSSGVRGVFCLASITALSPPARRGAIFGAMNMTAVLSGVAFQWGTGIIIDLFPAEAPGAFSAAGYLAGFSAVTLAVIASLLALKPMGREPFILAEEDGGV